MSAESINNIDLINEVFNVNEQEYLLFVEQHKAQLLSNNIPAQFWKPLCLKLKHQLLDAGNTFSMFYVENDETTDGTTSTKVIISVDFVDINDGNNIYLIDHAWTYNACEAKTHLIEVPGLSERMAKLMKIPLGTENLIDNLTTQMWKFNLTYSCSSLYNRSMEDQLPVWYVMDEFGSAIQHSDDPNFRVLPFLHLSEGLAYSVMFPVKSSCKGDEVTRDYVEGVFDIIERKAKLIPWFPCSLRYLSFEQNEPSVNYFISSRRNETLPNLNSLIPKDTNGTVNEIKPLKVFSQYPYVNEYLTSPKFCILSDERNADILWLTSHFKDFKELSEEYPSKFINQFPFECVLTVKDLLAIVCRRNKDSDRPTESELASCETQPTWLPTTFNLVTELPTFVSYFQHRQDKGLDNHWICKPWNLARGMDTLITNNLDCIVRLSTSGPKIAQKYIEEPVLFNREGIGNVKFDIRYVILLKSVQPLEVFVYKNFFLRFANKPFGLADFDDYEKHFTVMNYNNNANLHRLLCSEFIVEFNNQHADNKWCDIEPKILSVINQVFDSATLKDPPAGIGHNPQSRALYAADLMLSKRFDGIFEPKLLEINWTPDCQRACEYYPDFYNDIFELLFLDEEKNKFHKVSYKSSKKN